MKPLRHRTFGSCSNCVTISMPWSSPALVAFTTLVMRKSPEARKGKADAERAYPEWVPMAQTLRRAMTVMLCGGDHHFVDRSACRLHLPRQRQGREPHRHRARVQIAGRGNSPRRGRNQPFAEGRRSVLLRRCRVGARSTNPAGTLEGFHTVAQSHLCAQFNDLLRKQDPSLRGSVAALVPARRSRLARRAQRRERLRAACLGEACSAR